MELENKYFTVSRESIGFEPVNKVEETKETSGLINYGLRLKECERFLNLNAKQIKNGIKIEALKSVTVGDTSYICIFSALQVRKNRDLMQLILDEDEITAANAAKMLAIPPKYIKRLIEEGYLTPPEATYKAGLKIGEVKKLVPQLEEIRQFWKAKARINRQISVKKATEARKIIKGSTFKEKLFATVENFPYKHSILIKVAYSLLALNYYIDRKLSRNIADNELNELRNHCARRFIEFYKFSEFVKVHLFPGDLNVTYCSNCLEEIKIYEKFSFYKNRSTERINFLKEPCAECVVDNSLNSFILLDINIDEFSYNIKIPYSELKDWFETQVVPYNKDLFISEGLNQGFIDNEKISTIDLKSFKITELMEYLKEFCKIKDLDIVI